MIFRQDFKKLFVRAVFIFGWWSSSLIYIYLFFNVSYDAKESFFVSLMILFPFLLCLSYYWYYLKSSDAELTRNIWGVKKVLPIESITELSYEENPARPLVYITYSTPTGEDYIEFTTGVWSPHTLLSLNAELQHRNPNIAIKFDEKTKKHFEKDKDYHLHHPKSGLGWILLGAKYLLYGVCFGLLLVVIAKYVK